MESRELPERPDDPIKQCRRDIHVRLEMYRVYAENPRVVVCLWIQSPD